MNDRFWGRTPAPPICAPAGKAKRPFLKMSFTIQIAYILWPLTPMTDGPKDKDGKVGEGPDDTTSSASGLVGSGIAAVVGGVAIALM